MVSSVCRTTHRCLEYLGKAAPLPLFNRETFGSPEFPGYPFELMIRPQIPVVTSILAMSLRSAALQKLHSVGFPLIFLYSNQVYPVTTTIHFSGLYTDPLFLIHLASDSRCRVCPQVSLLPCRPDFEQMGLVYLYTHPLGNTSQFHPLSYWESQGSELGSAQGAFCYVFYYAPSL